jgi:SAM-dependent methyltransferase
MAASAIDPRRILSLPQAYRALQGLVGGERAWRSYIETVIGARDGERLLDLGCGPGHVVPWLPKVEYHGLDIDEDYIAEGRARFGDRAKFYRRPMSADAAADLGKFDVVVATGVLHHLDDATAASLFECAKAALKPGGRLVTCDGVKGEKAHPIANLLVSMDRGEFVRPRAAYEALARKYFDDVRISVRHDLSRVPYVHCVMQCVAA